MDRFALSRRSLLAAGGAMLASPLLARAQAAGPPPKVISTLVRKAGMTHDAFTRHWVDVHATMARSVPAVHGFIASEPIGAGTPNSDLLGEIDGIALIWMGDDKGAYAGGPGKAWIDDGDTFIDRQRSRTFYGREHVVVPIERRDGAIKRTLLTVRKPGVSREEFLDHWLGKHVELGRKVPGMAGSIFTVIERQVGLAPGMPPELDGITESWWHGAGSEQGARPDSPESRAFTADAETFVDMTRSRLIITREHITVPPPAA